MWISILKLIDQHHLAPILHPHSFSLVQKGIQYRNFRFELTPIKAYRRDFSLWVNIEYEGEHLERAVNYYYEDIRYQPIQEQIVNEIMNAIERNTGIIR